MQEINNLVDSLKNHICDEIKYSRHYPNICCVCGQAEPQPWRLRRHYLRHTKEKFFGCNICEYKSAFVNDVRKHMRKHTGEKPFQCSLCSYKAADGKGLRSHSKTHIHEYSKYILCPYCPKKFIKVKIFEEHMKKHNQMRVDFDPIKPLTTCYLCKRDFHKFEFEKHLSEEHNVVTVTELTEETVETSSNAEE